MNVGVGAASRPSSACASGVGDRGAWRRADELPLSPSDRMGTIVTVEGEWSFRFTK